MKYSICIRTLGTAGKKYEKLMNSIGRLDIKPNEVLVVLPYNYATPPVYLGYEKFIYSEKGMLRQRIAGYEHAISEYVLLVDDDIEFPANLMDILSEPISQNKAEVTFPIVTAMLPKKGLYSIVSILLLRAIPSLNSKYYVKIIPPAGYSYYRIPNNSNNQLKSQSAPGMCLLAKRDALLKLSFHDELWVELPPNYAYMEDAVLVYKLFINNYSILGIPNTGIKHLDAGSINKTQRRKNSAYATSFNSLVFFYRFCFVQKKDFFSKALLFLPLLYWLVVNTLFYLLNSLKRRDSILIRKFLNGAIDAYSYIIKKED